jgi:photosystem II stability/assembly factor-like uncharacterized protein
MGKQTLRLWTFAALTFLLAGPAWAGVGRWTPYGPPEGWLVTVAASEGRLFAASEESGVYASTDRGLSWFRSSTGMGNERIESLAVDPDDHDIYAAGQRHLFRSEDQGDHWVSLGPLPVEEQPAVKLLALAPGEPDVFFLAIANALYRSTDGGQIWFRVLTHTSLLLSVLVDPNDPDSVFVGTAQPGGLLHSADGGATWAPVTNVQAGPDLPPATFPFSFDVEELAAVDTEPTTLFAVSGLRLYRSTDAGASWVEVEVPEPTPDYGGFIESVVTTPGPSPRVYVFRQGTLPLRYDLFVSEDLGETWTKLTDQARGISLRVDPATGEIFSFDTGGLGIAEDEGATWRLSPLGNQCGLSGFPRPTPKVRFAPGRTYVVVGGALWVSRGRGWSVLSQELNEQCIAIRDVAIDRRTGVFWAAYSNGIYRSTNGGTTWTRLLGPLSLGDALPFQGVTQLDSRTILLSGYGIWRSGDRGATWQNTLSGNVLHDEFDEPEFTRAVYRVRVDPSNPQIVYAGVFEIGERHPIRTLPYVYQSLDGGRTWRRLVEGGYVLAIDPKQPRTLYVFSEGGLLRSRNRGRTWQKISDFDAPSGSSAFVPDGADLQVDPFNSRVLYTARIDGVWRSVDGGRNWSPLRSGLGTLPAFEIFPDPRRAGRLFVASEGLFEGVFALPGD